MSLRPQLCLPRPESQSRHWGCWLRVPPGPCMQVERVDASRMAGRGGCSRGWPGGSSQAPWLEGQRPHFVTVAADAVLVTELPRGPGEIL